MFPNRVFSRNVFVEDVFPKEAVFSYPASLANNEVSVTTVEASTISCPRPANTVAGDLLVAIHTRDQPGDQNPPAGFTIILTQNADDTSNLAKLQVSYKIAGSSEPTSYTANAGSDVTHQVLSISRIVGANRDDPIRVSASTSAESSTPTCPDLTATRGGLILRCFGMNGSGVTTDSGFPDATSGFYVRTQDSGTGRCSQGLAVGATLQDGAVGTSAFTATAVNRWAAATIEIAPRAAIVQTSEQNVSSAGQTSITTSKPSGTVEGDLLVSFHSARTTAGMSPPSGFTVAVEEQQGTNIGVQVAYKVAGASEPADYTATTAASVHQILYIARVTDFDPDDPIGVTGTANGQSQYPFAPDVTTSDRDKLLFRFTGHAGSNVNTDSGYPYGTNGLYMRPSGGSTGRCSSGLAYDFLPEQGAAGEAPFSINSSLFWKGITVAINPIPYEADNVPAGVQSDYVHVRNVDTGQRYYWRAQNTDDIVASTTKGGTWGCIASLGWDTYQKLYDEVATVDANDADGWSLSPFAAGDQVRLSDLINSSMLTSNNSHTSIAGRHIGQILQANDSLPTDWTSSMNRFLSEREAYYAAVGYGGHTATSCHGATATTGAAQQDEAEGMALVYADLHRYDSLRHCHTHFDYEVRDTTGTKTVLAVQTNAVRNLKSYDTVAISKNGATSNRFSLATVWDAPNGERVSIFTNNNGTSTEVSDTQAIIDQLPIDYPALAVEDTEWTPAFAASKTGADGAWMSMALSDCYEDASGTIPASIGGTVGRINSPSGSGLTNYHLFTNSTLRGSDGAIFVEVAANGDATIARDGSRPLKTTGWMHVIQKENLTSVAATRYSIADGATLLISEQANVTSGPDVSALGATSKNLAARGSQTKAQPSSILSRGIDQRVAHGGRSGANSVELLDARYVPETGANTDNGTDSLRFNNIAAGTDGQATYLRQSFYLEALDTESWYRGQWSLGMGQFVAEEWDGEPTITTATGAFQAQSATFSGNAEVLGPVEADGVFQAQSATFSGDARLIEIHEADGAFQAQSATFSGSATLLGLSAADGVFQAQSATFAGSAQVRHNASGVFQAQSATFEGRGKTGDGWTPVDTGGNEVWTPVDTGT